MLQVVAADAAAAASSSGSGDAPAEAFTAPGVAVNSASSSSGLDLNGLPTDQAKAAAIAWLEQQGIGHKQVGTLVLSSLTAQCQPLRVGTCAAQSGLPASGPERADGGAIVLGQALALCHLLN